MPNTSGQINTVVVTRDEIIQDALEDIEAIADGQTPQPGDLIKGARKLNFMLKLWATKGRLLWCLDTLQIPMVAGKITYTIGPIGADFISYRPLRAFDGTFVRFTVGGVSSDTTLELLSRKAYDETANKGALGIPNSFYYNPSMTQTPNMSYDPQQGVGILHVYVGPFDTSRVIHLKVQRPIQDITSATNAFDLPIEWYNALSKSLAVELCSAYGVPLQRKQSLMQDAKAALEEIVDWGATEEAPFTFRPDYQLHMGRRL